MRSLSHPRICHAIHTSLITFGTMLVLVIQWGVRTAADCPVQRSSPVCIILVLTAPV
ncbi:hypothetical protein METBIDRAFT_92842 [Metschnikowia bicuspidata var. bicuspidata NRRL YB-4993]|uniref:Uncharacterized protein n=1 Tax=Metschnikowia bicuspidata var. bicuspidata NRRL YB-4993 TaxID=869754 RepID=A0A1A0HF89_9ASCO|nr:hypothetical protein METBIDRAFT_92842 [Metschnikowia bicuspidata var. bicuspidata NRRL YB-4993]OBA22804.1 hypothetical protein METBIDRAFT_92842 [Metschnikowia bicuspidata var. bicuspidata NRRL YB-4993]